jgi:hypothetical protein
MTTRPTSRLRRSVLLFALLLPACAGAREHAILEQFFSASRVRDLTALQKIATVVFEPMEQGTVLDFDITSIQGNAEKEEVGVSALVRAPGGQVVRQKLRVTIAGGFVTSVAPSPPQS